MDVSAIQFDYLLAVSKIKKISKYPMYLFNYVFIGISRYSVQDVTPAGEALYHWLLLAAPKTGSICPLYCLLIQVLYIA